MAFSITEAQYKAILARLTAMEHHLNDLTVALDRHVTLGQVNELNVLLQKQIEGLSLTTQALESRVTAIEQEPIS